MTRRSGAPAWLFAFVDLAFLLLIALSQLGPDPRAVPLGELIVPRVAEAGTQELSAGAARRWQLRVHPPGAQTPGPYELVASDGTGERVAAPELPSRLAALHLAGRAKPVLAPHVDSRSEDLLAAVAWIEERWPGPGRVGVRRDPGP